MSSLKYFICIGTVLVMVFCTETNSLAYTAEELLQLNCNYWDKIHTLDIEYHEEHFSGGKLVYSVPSSRWILTSDRERLQTYGWHPIQQEEQTSSKRKNGSGIETCRVDFLRKTGKYYLLLRGKYPEGDPPKSYIEAKQLGLLAAKVDDTVFDPGSFENFSHLCPGSTWLNMRSQFLMRFSDVPNPPDETLESFAKKNRVSPPESSTNLRQERVWTFKISPKEPRMGDTDDMRYIEVCFNEDHGFVLERLAYYSLETWKNSPEKKLVVDNSFLTTDYFRLENGISFPKEICMLRYAVDEVPEAGRCQKIVLTSAKINDSIENDAFDFTIPPYVKVTHFPPVQKDGELFFVESIWGHNNEPMITFTEPGQFEAYIQERWIESLPIFPFRIFLITSGTLLCVIVLLLKFRKR